MGKTKKAISPSKRFAEAFYYRLGRIQTEWEETGLKRHRKPAIDLQLAIHLGKIEEILGIKYGQDACVSDSNEPTCTACGKRFKRVNDLDKHIRKKHGFLKPILDAATCHLCSTKFESHRQLVLHERGHHKATYRSRVELIWPGYTQPNSEEAEQSFLEFLHQGDKEKPNVSHPLERSADESSPVVSFTGCASISDQTPQHHQEPYATPPTHFQFDETGFYSGMLSLPMDIDAFIVNNLHSSDLAFGSLTNASDGGCNNSCMLGRTEQFSCPAST